MPFKCEICVPEKYFQWRSNVYSHMKKVHPETRKVKELKFQCGTCGKRFYSQTSYYRHKRSHKSQNIEPGQSDRIFKCTECNMKSFNQMKDFKDHLLITHADKYKIEKLDFNNEAEFESWRESVEIHQKCNFVIKNAQARKGFQYKLFHCNRAGVYRVKEDRKRKLKAAGICKMNGKCTANIVARVYPAGNVQVEYVPFHYGHLLERKYLRLRKSEKAFIRSKLESGMPTEAILKECHENSAENSCMRLLTLKNIYRMACEGKVKEKLDMSCNELNEESSHKKLLSSPKVAYYYVKNAGEDDPEGCLDKSDFVTFFFTKYQIELAREFMGDVVFMGSNRKMNVPNYVTTSILILDQYGQGMPVGWLISNSESFEVLRMFLSKFRETLEPDNLHLPNYFMSDCVPQYYEAWQEVFGGKTVKLLCAWNVKKTWKRKLQLIKNVSAREELYKKLCSIMECLDTAQFIETLDKLLNSLDTNQDGKEFADYFRAHWVSCCSEWALCCRIGSGINYNTFLATIHKKLKFQQSNTECNLEEYISCLLEFTQVMEYNYSVWAEKPPLTFRQQIINKQHELVGKIKQVICSGTTQYMVSSKALNGIFHTVTLEQDKCPRKYCELKCRECKVCVHLYSCTCKDWATSKTICKHIHAVCMKNNEVIPVDECGESETLVTVVNVSDELYVPCEIGIQIPMEVQFIEATSSKKEILEDSIKLMEFLKTRIENTAEEKFDGSLAIQIKDKVKEVLQLAEQL